MSRIYPSDRRAAVELKALLARQGIDLRVLLRCEKDGSIISVRLVRWRIRNERMQDIRLFVPACPWDYFCSAEGTKAIETICRGEM